MALILDETVIQGTVDGASVTYTYRVCHQSGYSAHVYWTHGGAATGEVKLQASNYEDSHFKDIPDSDCAITTSDTADSVLWSIDGMKYTYVKIICTSTSGEITFTGKLTIKRVKPTE